MSEQNPGPASTANTPITPRPKQILNLRNTLAAKPSPRPAGTPPTPTPSAAPTETRVVTGNPQPAAPIEPPSTTPQPATGTAPVQPATPTAPVRPDTSSASAQPTTDTAPAQSATGTAPAQSATGTAPAQLAADGQPRRRRDHTVFYLPIEVSDRLRDVARRQNKTNADVIFDAIEAALPDLPSLLAQPSSQRDGGVFDRRAMKPVGQKVQISAVISPRNLALIDQMVADHGADSRSQLVEASLNVYLADHDAVTV